MWEGETARVSIGTCGETLKGNFGLILGPLYKISVVRIRSSVG